MGDPGGTPVAVTIAGGFVGTALDGTGTISVGDGVVQLRSGAGETALEMEAMEGVHYRDSRLVIYLRGGETVELSGTARLAAVAREISAQACTLPELTRPLRSLGSRRGRLGADHDRFFAPLLAARRRGERAADQRARLRAFDGAAMGNALDAAIADFARARFPRRAPDRRALEAELLEISASFRAALEALDVFGRRALEEGTDETMFVRWRSWCTAVREVFDRADRCWIAFGPVLGEAPVRGPLWRRVLRLR